MHRIVHVFCLIIEGLGEKCEKIGIVVFVIAIILIILGLSLFFLPKVDNTKDTKKLQNDSKKLKELHCLDDLCVKKMDVIYDNKQKVGTIRFYLQNTGSDNLSSGFVKVIFDNNNQKEFIFRYSDFLPQDIQSVEIQFTDKDIIQTTDYRLHWLSEEELQSINS